MRKRSGKRIPCAVLVVLAASVTQPATAEASDRPWLRINPEPGSTPLYLTHAESGVYFSADDGAAGRELWRLAPDGEFHMVADLVPGPGDADPGFLMAHNATLFFWANQLRDNGRRARQLFMTQGFADSTRSLSDFAVSPEIVDMVVTEWGVVFSGSTAAEGLELWAALRDPDAPGGWGRAAPLPPFGRNHLDGVSKGPLIEHHGTVAFSARIPGEPDGDQIVWVWRAGDEHPSPLLDRQGGRIPCSGELEGVSDGDTLFFVSRGRRYDLWKANRDLSEVEPLLFAVSSVPRPSQLAVSDGKPYFTYQGADVGRELFTLKERTLTPVLVADLNPGPGSSKPYAATAYRDGFVLNATHDDYGIEPWYVPLDGSAPVMLGDFVSGPVGSHPYQLTAFDDHVYFSCNHDRFGEELWRTDGTPTGTRIVKDMNPGPALAEPYHLLPVGDRLLFTARTPDAGEEIWSLNAGDENPEPLDPIRPVLTSVRSSRISELVAVNTRVCFVAETEAEGRELWVSDGTWSGTRCLIDLAPGPRSSSPAELAFTSNNGGLQFEAADAAGVRQWWRYDFASGDVEPAPAVMADVARPSHEMLMWNLDDRRLLDDEATPDTAGKIGDLNLFAGWTQEHGRELWAIRDHEHYPYRVVDLFPGPASGNPSEFVSAGDYVVFRAQEQAGAASVWISDGTRSGTREVGLGVPEAAVQWEYGVALLLNAPDNRRRILTYSPSTNVLIPHLTRWQEQALDVRDLVAAGTRLYFVALHPSFGEELWCIDGLEQENTRLVRDLTPNVVPSDMHVAANDSAMDR